MTEQQIKQAFEGRWRIKSGRLAEALELMLIEYRIDYVKKLCLDFFKTGILLADKESVVNSPESIIFIDTDKIKLSDIVPLNEGSRLALDLNFPFETFWNMYDKKVGKPKCEKLWEKLTAKERMACFEYIPLYKQAQPDKQFRKNPETFLRNKSWQDEIIVRNNPNLQRQQRIAASAELVARYAAESNSAQSEAPATD